MKLSELVNIGELQQLCESFTGFCGATTAILDLQGNILVATGWKDICTRFHRVHPETACRCRESDTVLAGRLPEGERYIVYQCRNGLVDVAMPIAIGGEHVANFFNGQFFFEPPDEEYFVRQAEEFGFDRTAYLDALREVPVFSKYQVERMMDFLSRLARLIGEMGLAKKELEGANSQLRNHQEHLEELVRERTSDLNLAQKIAHIGSWRWNVRTNDVSWSDEMFRVLGVQPGKQARLTHETYLSQVHQEDRKAVAAGINRAISERLPFSDEFRTIPIDGRERIVRTMGEVRCDSNGETVELFGTDQDVTEEKLVQQSLAEAKERAEAANRAKSAFLANMSHELRTPLNAVLGFSRLMKDSPEVTEEQMGYLDIIMRSGEHLLNLINNVLDISKIESGRVTLEETSLDLHQLMHEMQSMMAVKAYEKGLSFTVQQSPEIPGLVAVDAHKLRQVLINLIGNAIKYTREGGIVLRAEGVKEESPDRVRVRFEVVDSGPGIRGRDREKIFIPFVQLGERAPTEAGTGLGLAISKQYVELMGGRIGVSGEPGKGSVFYFEIPVAVLPAMEVHLDPQRGQVTGLAEGQPRYRLLIVEDQPENRLLLYELLEPLGFDLRLATNGREAVEVFEQWSPHLIWMDIRMPVMDGLEATRRIRATEAGSLTKIVALTAHALEDERREILAAGCDDFIRKPYRLAEILEALPKHLGVCFQYADGRVDRPGGESDGLSAEQLRKLPPVLIEQLLKAVELLDDFHCIEVASRIGEIDRELGELVHRMVENLEYKELLAVLDSLVGEGAA